MSTRECPCATCRAASPGGLSGPAVSAPPSMTPSREALSSTCMASGACRLIERRSLLDATFLHATSRAEARAVRAWAPGAPVVTLPNGVEAPAVAAAAGSEIRRRLGVPEGAPLVTFLGRIHPIKRLDLLAQAFDRVLTVRPDTHLVIAGPDERAHRGEIEPRFAARAVHWAGQLGETDKWALLSASSLLVLCSDSESFGLSAAEAMAAGVPVVATRTCPWEEIETVGAGFWVAQEPEAVAAGMRTLLDDPARARAMGERGRALVGRRRATLATVLVGIECWRPLRRLERVAFERAGRLLAISQHTVRRFREANPDLAWRDVTVCHLATPALEESIDHEARAAAGGFALIVGRMASSERYKGHDLLIDIWPRLLAEIPDARLVVAGAGDDLPRLEAKAAPLGAAIRFEGRVTDTGLGALYRDCAFFVMPSSEEGFGLVV